MKTLSCQYTSERKLLSQQGLSGDKVLSKDQNILCEKSCNVINFAKLRKCPNWAKKGLIERKVWLVLFPIGISQTNQASEHSAFILPHILTNFDTLNLA